MCKVKTFRLKTTFAERLDGIAPPLKCSLINFLKACEKFQRGKKRSAAEEVKQGCLRAAIGLARRSSSSPKLSFRLKNFR